MNNALIWNSHLTYLELEIHYLNNGEINQFVIVITKFKRIRNACLKVGFYRSGDSVLETFYKIIFQDNYSPGFFLYKSPLNIF